MTNTNSSEKQEAGASDNDASDPRSRFPRQAERLRRDVPITKVIGECAKLRGTRKRLTGDCPLHEGFKRTLQVYPKTNTFQCLFCGAAGDAIDFLEKVGGLTYNQALEELERIKYSDEHPDAG